MTFRDIAIPVARLGVPVTPLQPRTKVAFLSGWQHSATTDLAQIEQWDQQFPQSNCGAVATGKPGDVWFFEADKPEVLDRIASETGHDLLTEVPTYPSVHVRAEVTAIFETLTHRSLWAISARRRSVTATSRSVCKTPTL